MQPDHRSILRTATIDERLSSAFETLPGRKNDADQAAKRLAAWCRACAGGDWLAFGRRLARDGLATAHVLARFASVRHVVTSRAKWLDDVVWIEPALLSPDASADVEAAPGAVSFAFEQLLLPLVEQAETRLWTSLPVSSCLTPSAKMSLRHLLMQDLCGLCAPAFYEKFDRLRSRETNARQVGADRYDCFVARMRADGFRQLLDDKPVLLRLICAVTRQWLDTSREFVMRLDADLPIIRRELIGAETCGRVAHIQGHLSDPHNGGRSILIVAFEDKSRVVYKPKDLRLDVLWHALIERLNETSAPVALRAMRAVACDGYGWTEHIAHVGLTEGESAARFFRRAGAWLALLHCFAATDMHHENMIAAGDHPVPIDLETLLQAASEEEAEGADSQAVEAAKRIIANSVMATGVLPAYGRTSDNDIFVAGGIASDWTSGAELTWRDLNSDGMRPVLKEAVGKRTSNLPHLDGVYAKFGDHIDDLVAGFRDYASFLKSVDKQTSLFDGWAGLPVRRVVRPTQFYYTLLQRLKDDRSMEDGGIWSAQADFLSRLADWDTDCDPQWPLLASERAALLDLNVPMFFMTSDGTDLFDQDGLVVRSQMTSGLERARVRALDVREIEFQADVIRQNSDFASRSPRDTTCKVPADAIWLDGSSLSNTTGAFVAEADRIADELSNRAIRRESGATWIGRGWLRDSDVSQLTVLGPDLYSGVCGIALFLAAHASASGRASSAELALAALSDLRKSLGGQNASRLTRSLGLGGATGLGSIVYALAAISKLLQDGDLRADAHQVAELFTDDLIAADKQLDVVGGSAGAILGLLRLHRDTQSDEVLSRAIRCGEHLLAQPRVGPTGFRTWRIPGPYPEALTGMSHGAAGFALALASLAAATGRRDALEAASECIAFENASYDASRHNWPDVREGEPHWRSQWCHGAVGIGLARLGMSKAAILASCDLATDVENALEGARNAWPGHADTLCCGTLGSIELLLEAGRTNARVELCGLSARRLRSVLHEAEARGDYRWNGGERRFNLGLFRGLAGVGYTCLRQGGPLPNVLVWE